MGQKLAAIGGLNSFWLYNKKEPFSEMSDTVCYGLIGNTMVMPRSHIHGSPGQFHYGSNLTDDPGNAIFSSPIRMHNGVATRFDVSTKAKL